MVEQRGWNEDAKRLVLCRCLADFLTQAQLRTFLDRALAGEFEAQSAAHAARLAREEATDGGG